VRGSGSEPVFAAVVDLERAEVVCRLKGFETTPPLENTLLTEGRLVYASRYGLTPALADGYRVGCWNLQTGEHVRLDNHPWSGDGLPDMELSPDGAHLLVCGRLFRSGDGHARIFDIADWDGLAGGRAAEKTWPWPVRPHAFRTGQDHFAILLENPQTKAREVRRNRWKDGSSLEPAAPAGEVVRVWRDAMGGYQWLLLHGPRGLGLQRGLGAEVVWLEQTDAVQGIDVGTNITISWPESHGGAFALVEPLSGLWNADTGKLVGLLPEGHRCLGFDLLRRKALSFDAGKGEVKVWDTRTGREVVRCVPGDSKDLAFDLARAEWHLHPDGLHLAVLSQGVLHLWDLKANRRVKAIPPRGHTSPVRCVVRPTGRDLLVASTADEGVILLWDRTTGRLSRAIVAHRGPITALSFSPDGKRIASACEATISLHDLEGNRQWSRRVPDGRVTCLAYHPIGSEVLAGTQDGQVVVLNSQTGESDRAIDRREHGCSAVQAAAYSADGAQVVVGTASGQAYLYEAGQAKPKKTWSTSSPVTGVAFVADGLAATAGSAIQFWDTQETGQAAWTLETARGNVSALAFNDRTGDLAALDQGKDVVVYSLPALHDELRRRGLGIEAFPARKWNQPAPRPAGPPPPSPDDWRGRAEELYRQKDWGYLVWVCSVALARDPTDDRLRLWQREAEARLDGR
jgi:WD40 repeat protein